MEIGPLCLRYLLFISIKRISFLINSKDNMKERSLKRNERKKNISYFIRVPTILTLYV